MSAASCARRSCCRHAQDFAADRISADELRVVEDEAIRDVVKLQEDVGLRSATDGEFRRASWHMDFIYQLGGISKSPGNLSVKFHNADGDIEFTPAAMHIDGKVTLEKPIFAADFEFLEDVTTARHAQAHDPQPEHGPLPRRAGGDRRVGLPRHGRLLERPDRRLRRPGRGDGELGCTYLQFDDTSLAYLNDPNQRAEMAAKGNDAEHLHESYIRHINEALAKRPEGMAITTHMCRGNFRSSWVAEGGYDFVAEALFNELAVDGFFMEWDDARSRQLRAAALRAQGQGRRARPGDDQERRARDQELPQAARIEEASKYVDVDQLCLSPQCGFSSTVEGNALSVEQQAAKLRLIVETAEEVWG